MATRAKNVNMWGKSAHYRGACDFLRCPNTTFLSGIARDTIRWGNSCQQTSINEAPTTFFLFSSFSLSFPRIPCCLAKIERCYIIIFYVKYVSYSSDCIFFFMFVPFKKLIFFAIHHSILAWLGTELYDFFDEIISVHDPGHRFVNSSWQYQSFSRSFFYTYFFSISSFNIRFVENQALLFSLPSFLWDYFGLITWITGLAI